MSEALRLADDLSQDYCHCHEGFKCRGLVDPQCESCNTEDWRHQAAAELRRLHALNTELVEALRQIATSQIPIWHRDLAREVLEKMEVSK